MSERQQGAQAVARVTGIARIVGVHLSSSTVAVAVITRRVSGECITTTAMFTSRAAS